MARYKMRKRRKKKKDVPTYRCPQCRGVLEQLVEYSDTWRCGWCGFECATVSANGQSSPVEYWKAEGVTV
jgi:ssDNA-binding Zn-finger/Zn-ribbon topoisomerase 1